MYLRFVFTVFCMVALVLTSIAQDEDNGFEPWPIIERCLPDPSEPPADWDFDGQVLMRGWAGLHILSSDFDTTRVAVWMDRPWELDAGSGRLSPNGQRVIRWDYDYVVEANPSGPVNAFLNYTYYDIEVVNIDTGETQVFPWPARLSLSNGPYPWPPAGPLWIGNERFVSFGGGGDTGYQVGDVLTGDVSAWSGDALRDYEVSISPDGTRLINYSALYDLTEQTQISENAVGTNQDLTWAVWAPDSSHFADFVTDGYPDNTRYLTIFDRDGELVSQPIAQTDHRLVIEGLSPDATQLLFTEWRYPAPSSISEPPEPDRPPFLIDLKEQVIYDLCIPSVNGWTWSPDGVYAATIMGDGQSPVVVIDWDEWQPYIVAYHTGWVLMWRSMQD